MSFFKKIKSCFQNNDKSSQLMNLDTFISDALTQISNGIKDAQKKVGGIEVSDKDKHFFQPIIVPSYSGNDKESLQMISFDVAVMVSRSSSNAVHGKIFVVASMDGELSSKEEYSSISRIKFSIPMRYPISVRPHGS